MANHLINVTPDENAWKEAAKRWHREFLKMPVLAMKDTTKFMTGLPGCRTNQYLGTVESEAQFYPYVANQRGDGSTAINFEELEIYFGSMIHDFVPNDYVQTLLGEHADVLGMGQAKSEMAKLILGTIMQSAGEKLALAIPVAVRDASGNTTMDLFNGLVTLINTAITDGKVALNKHNYYRPHHHLSVNNIVDEIKQIEFALDPRLRRQERFLYCDPAIVDMYNEGYLLTHPAVPYNEKYEQLYVEGSNRRMTFAPLDGLAGSGIMFIAPKMNVIYGYDGVSDEEKFEVLRLDADTMTVNAKIFFGVGFRTYDYRFLKVIHLLGEDEAEEDEQGDNPGGDTPGGGGDGEGDGDDEQDVLAAPVIACSAETLSDLSAITITAEEDAIIMVTFGEVEETLPDSVSLSDFFATDPVGYDARFLTGQSMISALNLESGDDVYVWAIALKGNKVSDVAMFSISVGTAPKQ